MRIRAIRGENLASLGGTFNVPLTGEVLGRAGLFAITGPTGAGKSTLLDAICLCLYDTTPRLAKSGGSVVRLEGTDDAGALKATDQRNILRRGTGAGWAEVDFTGRDGRDFTARWEVRRARKSPTGRIQGQEWSLRLCGADPDDVLVAGKKTEVGAAIRQQVGLDFDQFRRSVLLAQGDFAAFLKATEHERAVLLEQMTGSEIYTRLSREAFNKARDLRSRRKELTIQLGEHAALTAEGRQAAEQALAAAAVQRTTAAAAEKQAETAVAWHVAAKQLDTQLDRAESDRKQAALAVESAAPRRSRLGRMELAWPLRALADTVRRSERAGHSAAEALARSVATRAAASQAVEGARTRSVDAARTVAAASHGLHAQLDARLQRARAGREQCVSWLDARPLAVRLCLGGELVRLVGDDTRPGSLAKRVELVRRVTELEQVLRPGVAARRTAAVEKVEAAKTARASAETALLAATSTATTARAAVVRAEEKVPESLGTALRARRDALTRLAGLVRRATDVLGVRAAAVRVVTEEARKAAASRAAMEQADQQLATLAQRLTEAEASLARAQAAVSASSLRDQLQPGEPCSVCGSVEHPWADGSPLARVFGSLEARVRELRADQATHTAQKATAASQVQAAGEARGRGERQVADADARLQEVATAWQAAAEVLPERDAVLAAVPSAGSDPALLLAELGAHLAALEASWQADQAAVRAARAAVEVAATAERAARVERDRAARALEAATAAVPALDQELVRLDGERDKLTERVASIEGEVDRMLGPLAAELADTLELAPLQDWRAHCVAPEPVMGALRTLARSVSRYRARQDQAEAAVAELRDAVPAARARAEAAEQAVAGSAPVALDAPDGSPPERSRWWQQQLVRAEEALAEARRALQAAELRVQEATQAESAARAIHATHTRSSVEAQARLTEEVARLGTTDAELQAVCALPAAWADTERPALDALDRALHAAVVRVEERKAGWHAHAATRPAVDARAAGEALASVQAARAAADEAWSTCRAAIATDDAARAASARLTEALRVHDTVAEPWLQLSDCIGSASGKELRKYAQSLTLELLLEQANDHLRRLHPRYRLARIAGTDLDILVIDGDLGDEARTVRGLSGGEGFLVSLALALGLASLSARDVRVESLFIDEGFGTLDASSLDKALAVLDSLQSEGRQVGIISHVGGLAERIGAQVRVEPQGGGRSRVQVVSGGR